MANSKGILLALFIVVAEIVGVLMALRLDDISAVTAVGRDEANFVALALPVNPRTVVATDQTGDAGVLYRAAVDAYLADVSLYETFLKDKTRADIPKLTALAKLLDATHLSGGRIYADKPDDVVVYGDSTPVTAMKRLGETAINVGLMLEKREGDRAKKHYEAAFSLGMRMFDERLTYRELAAGIELMSTAGACLAEQARKAGDAALQAKILSFTEGQRDYTTKRILPILETLYTMNEAKIGEHAGDVFAFVSKSADRVWRVEAVMKLGRMRYNVGNPGRPGDQRGAERLVHRLAESEPDPIVRRAAEVARDLTVEQFRMLR